ncbi:MAG: hypothetical protein JRE14_04575 [Deltaproteobacteria bacterium]|nr:hypothetical protein [Deltaproteobacteria bacterium]
METKTKNILNAAMTKLMRPLVRIMLRDGISFRQLSDLIKWVYVDVATKEFGISGRKQTDSRISVITGLSRKDVRRMKNILPPSDQTEVQSYNRAARVIAGWRKDPDFINSDGSPLTLKFDGMDLSFSHLVQRYSGDVPPRSVLDEIERVGAVHVTKDRKIHLKTDAYVPTGDQPALLSILGTDVSELVNTIDWNMTTRNNGRFFQRKVAYDNLPTKAADAFKNIGAEEGQKLLEKLDQWLSNHDRDINPSVKGNGRKRCGLGIYYFEETIEKQNSSVNKGEKS